MKRSALPLQAETERLRTLKAPSSVEAEVVVTGVDTGHVDAKMQHAIAALEARLQARTERVQTLVSELAAVKGQLAGLEEGKAQVQVFMDDGRRSWCHRICLAPMIALSARAFGKRSSRAIQKILSKQATALMQTRFVSTADLLLRYH